ncbi:profilin [Elysia marginata]|uniref:Profilin n=1 Tax=Elysia marginata TaxID=1093978 RepID=A0AAV4J951_9GAST|nr:profilin [Elysia marginata]
MAPDKSKSRTNSTQSSTSSCDNKWEVYTQTLIEKGAVSGFGVYSNTHYHKWTSTLGFRVKPEELRVIISGFEDELPLRVEGIWINNTIYTFTRMGLNRRVMVGRNTASGAGCVLYLCRTCLLVATCEAQQSSLCFTTIERLGDVLTARDF